MSAADARDMPPQALQESFLCLLLVGPPTRATRDAIEMLEARDFTPPLDAIARRALDYWKHHKETPGKVHIDDIFDPELNGADPEKADSLKRLLNGALRYQNDLNPTFLLERVNYLKKQRRLTAAIIKAAERSQRLSGSLKELDDIVADLDHEVRALANGQDLTVWDAGDDDLPIPPRGWLLGTQFCRGAVSALLGAGAVGKTALRIAQALALAADRQDITGEHVWQRARVLLLCFEDDKDELARRVQAAMIQHGVEREDIKGYLFLGAPQGLKLVEGRYGKPTVGPLDRYLRREIERDKVDLVILDPLVRVHSLDENDNAGIDFVINHLAGLAAEYNIAVDVTHHVRKGPAAPGDPEAGRGASSFVAGARLVYTLQTMTSDEAGKLGLSEDQRRALIRRDPGKVNTVLPLREATWFQLVGVNLNNGNERYEKGDTVQAVECWKVPGLYDDIDQEVIEAILDDIHKGPGEGVFYSNHHRTASDRAAWTVVRKRVPDIPERRAREMVDQWVKRGALESFTYRNANRKEAQGLRRGEVREE